MPSVTHQSTYTSEYLPMGVVSHATGDGGLQNFSGVADVIELVSPPTLECLYLSYSKALIFYNGKWDA